MGNNGFHCQRYRWRGIWIRSIFLNDFVNNPAQTIKVGSIGAIYADNKHSHGYYMVEFSSSPYTLKENKNIDGQVI